MDFMSDALLDGRRIRTLNIIDDFNREVLAIDVDTSLPAQRVIRTLERISDWRGYPKRIRIDNGPEFISGALHAWADQHTVYLDFIQPGRPAQNAYIERFNRTYRQEDSMHTCFVTSRRSDKSHKNGCVAIITNAPMTRWVDYHLWRIKWRIFSNFGWP